MAPKKRKSVAENVDVEAEKNVEEEKVSDNDASPVKKKSRCDEDVDKKEVDIKREADETSVTDAPPLKKSRPERSDDVANEADVKQDSDDAQKTSLAKESEVTTDNATPDGDGEDVVVSKKRRQGRKRMKKVYSGILQQMEFYFSDANLAKSNFMQEKLKDSEWLDLNVFMNFNKLAGMLMSAFGRVDPEDLFSALSALPSDLLEVRKIGNLKEIRRKKEVVTREKHEEDACTIYVENLPPSATIESVTNLFDKFGKVLYVSLPKYKITQVVKGYAFVEFDKPESAGNALKALVAEKSRLRPDMDPAELQSVKTFISEQEMEKESSQKQQQHQSKAGSLVTESSKVAVKEKKKSRGKKNKQKEVVDVVVNAVGFHPPQQDTSLDFSGLQILSKAEWKKLRNTYLNLQRKNMSQAKQKIRQYASQQQQQEHYETEKAQTEIAEPAAEVAPKKENEGLAFEPKVVVRFAVEEPIYDVAALKKKIKAAVMEPVKYIDARPAANVFYVRCGSPEQAKTLSNVKILGDGKVLSDSEEKEYWTKANKDREEKLGGKVKVKTTRLRGKDKVTKQFKKMEEQQQQSSNSHKFFEEED